MWKSEKKIIQYIAINERVWSHPAIINECISAENGEWMAQISLLFFQQ